MNDLLATLPSPLLASSALSTAIVREVSADGGVLCAGIWCDQLRGSLPSTPLAPGDEVLVCRLPERQRGIVIGRIGGGERAAPPAEVVIEARAALTMRCGEGSLTLRGDGKILISGSDIVSRAKRRNRIKGGSVAIN